MLKRRRVGVPPRMAVSDPAGARRPERGFAASRDSGCLFFSGPMIVASMGGAGAATGARALRLRGMGAVGSQTMGSGSNLAPREMVVRSHNPFS